MVGVWVKRSLQYYGARHLAFAGTVALTSAILGAALLTGESLQRSLRGGLEARLGGVRSAVALAEGVFPAALARRLPDAQAALLLRGELLNAAGAVCSDRAQVIGLEAAPEQGGPLGVWTGALNARGREAVADAQGAVRFERPALYSVELPLGAAKESRLVRRPVRFEQGGSVRGPSALTPDFALRPDSVPPVNLLLPHAALAEAAGVPGMANVLVSTRSQSELEHALAAALTPEDAGLALERGAGEAAASETVVKSRRVFLPRGVPEAMAAAGLKAAAATFHLADSFEAGTRATPYGFVAAAEPGLAGVPEDLKDDEVAVSAWLAQTLGVRAGDSLTLRWRRFAAGGRLVAEHQVFRVRQVVPTEEAALARRAMPSFPGLEGVDSCAQWDVGLPMDEEKLKDPANEAYWKQWRETPKAFLTYAAGRRCFGSAFGDAMSVRVAADEASVRRALKALTPAQAGFVVRPLWEEGLRAAEGATDFKGLFAGMAFVLMASALLLSSLSLVLALETRKGEVALFSALGWRRGRVVGVLAAEWSVPLVAGALAGGALAAALAQALVWGLGRFWLEAFAGAQTLFHFSWPVAAQAVGASAALAFAVLLRTVWRFARCSPVELWQSVGRDLPVFAQAKGARPGAAVSWASAAGCALAVAGGGVMALSPSGAAANGAFFGAGFLLMVSLLLFARTAGTACAGRRVYGPAAAGFARAVLAPRRSATVVVLLAVGAFLTVGILSMKHDPAEGCEQPWSGSGGFASIVTSVAPLERERGLALARRVSGAPEACGAVPVRVREGDEAGCLNMSRPAAPRVLGLSARTLARARAFEPRDSGGIWNLLEARLPDGAVPALAADQTMLQYSLHAKAGLADGTVFEYPGQGGGSVRLRVVGALPVRSGILQGALLVDESRFVESFADTGYRMWLCTEVPSLLKKLEGKAGGGQARQDAGDAARRLRHPEPGVTLQTVEERLRLLGSVESAYLDMFLVLGGLGVVLGVAGVALVVLRGVQERRGELALLNAVGLGRGVAMRLLGAEYGVMVAAGLVVGVVPALVAIQPAARALGGALPWGAMAGVIVGLCACAAVSVAAAARAAARRYGPEALKEEG